MMIDIALMFFLLFFVSLLVTVFVHMVFLVPYVPSANRVVKKMISAAQLKPKETVYDLGCGDGRLLLMAEKKKAKAIGFEIAPLVFLLALLRKIIARSRAQILFKSLFAANLRKANVIFCYLIPNVMPRLSAKIKKECKKGTRIVSNTFHIPGLKPYRIYAKDAPAGTPTVYVYKI